jgi:hypothetical protein
MRRDDSRVWGGGAIAGRHVKPASQAVAKLHPRKAALLSARITLRVRIISSPAFFGKDLHCFAPAILSLLIV